MNCPYQINMGCVYLDTAGMFKMKECYECEHYSHGVRPTGATPLLAWILKKLGYKPKEEDKEMDDHNRFMMGL